MYMYVSSVVASYSYNSGAGEPNLIINFIFFVIDLAIIFQLNNNISEAAIESIATLKIDTM